MTDREKDMVSELLCAIQNCSLYLKVHSETTTKEVMEKKNKKIEKISEYAETIRKIISKEIS